MDTLAEALTSDTRVDRDTLSREFEARLVESSTLAFRVAYGVLRHRAAAPPHFAIPARPAPPPASTTVAIGVATAPPPSSRPEPDDVAALTRPAPPIAEPAGARWSIPAGRPAPRLARVVVSQTEAAALRRLLARVRDRQVVLPARAAPFDPVASLPPPRDLVIPPITLKPITLARFDQGAVP